MNANFNVFDTVVGNRLLNAAALSAILELNPDGLQGAALAGALSAPPAIGEDTPNDGHFADFSTSGSFVSGTVVLAAAGANQGNAAAIPAACSIVMVTVTASTQGVRLPAAEQGKEVTVMGAASVGNKVYPASGALIQGLSTNAAYNLAAGKSTRFVAESATRWRYMAGA